MPDIEIAGRFQATIIYTAHLVRKLIPTPTPRPYPLPTSSPRGSHPEVCRWRGGGGACGWGYDPLPGGFGAPPWGHYDPCARSSLEGMAVPLLRSRDATRPASDREGLKPFSGSSAARDKGDRASVSAELASRSAGHETPCRISAARRLKNADKRSATGRADGGSIHPRRILA